MKKLWMSGLAAVAAAVLMAPSARAADSPVAPFVTPMTNAVIHVDISQIDMDAIDALVQKARASAPNPNAAQAAKEQADEKKGIVKAKKWINDFEAAGGRDLYVVVDISGLFQGVGPGEVVVPMDAAASSDALTKLFQPNPPPPVDPNNPNGNPRAMMQPGAAIIGKTLVWSTNAMINRLKSTPPAPAGTHNGLSDALEAQKNSAIQIAVSPSSIRNNPMIAMFTQPMGGNNNPNGPPPAPMSEPQWNNCSWILVSVTPPPKESGTVICQCTDAASAQALCKLIEQKMAEEPKTPPPGPQIDKADRDKLKTVFKPTVSGTQVKMGVDKNTFDDVILPIFAKMTQRQTPPPQQPMQGGGPGMQQNPNMPPDNGPPGNGGPPNSGM